jgi:hypothetical protein
VITKDAKSKKGIFTVHQIKDKYYYEIPKGELGKQFLLNTQISKTTLGVGYGGQQLSSRMVYWELNGNKINLRSGPEDSHRPSREGRQQRCDSDELSRGGFQRRQRVGRHRCGSLVYRRHRRV